MIKVEQINHEQNLRGFSNLLVEKYRASSLCTLLNEDKDLMAYIRNDAIGIYHLANKVAMVRLNGKEELVCSMNDYYISGEHSGKEHRHTVEVICKKIENIKKNSNSRNTPEKKAQHTLVTKTNLNRDAEWYCVDIEYRQSPKVQNDVINVFKGRFDIIAVSKKAPHRVAVIELKYNSSAISGKSGIVKHIEDFYTFSKNYICYENLCKEIVCQLHNIKQIGIYVPEILLETPFEFSEEVEFYVVTLWDDKNDPKEKMGRYLFSDPRKKWVGEAKKTQISTKNAMKELGIDIENNPPFKIKFLFKEVQSPTEFDIDDILKETTYKYVL